MEPPQDSNELKQWYSTKLLRLIFLHKESNFLDRVVTFAHKCIQNEHIELIDGISESFLQCIDQPGEAPKSRCLDEKYFVIIHAIITCDSMRSYIEKHNHADNLHFHAWHRFAESEMEKFRSRLTHDGQTAETPEQVCYPHLNHYVEAVIQAYLTSTFYSRRRLLV